MINESLSPPHYLLQIAPSHALRQTAGRDWRTEFLCAFLDKTMSDDAIMATKLRAAPRPVTPGSVTRGTRHKFFFGEISVLSLG